MPEVVRKLNKFLEDHPKLYESGCLESMFKDGANGTRLLDLMTENQYRRVQYVPAESACSVATPTGEGPCGGLLTC